MHVTSALRVGNLTDDEQKSLNMPDLPDETHIINGTLEGDGAVSLASDKAKLSARVIKLERTDSGGIAYQLAIFASEPTPAPVAVMQQQRTAYDDACDYFVSKGMSRETAQKQVERFGVQRVIAMREKELDEELAGIAKRPTVNSETKEVGSGSQSAGMPASGKSK